MKMCVNDLIFVKNPEMDAYSRISNFDFVEGMVKFIESLDFSLSFSWREAQKSKEEIINLPEIIARKKGISRWNDPFNK